MIRQPTVLETGPFVIRRNRLTGTVRMPVKTGASTRAAHSGAATKGNGGPGAASLLKTTLLIHLFTPWFKRGVLTEWGESSLRTDGFPMTVAIAGAVSSPPGGMPVAALTCRRFEI